MNQRRRWTNEEEQVLIDQVRQNPSNLSRAFRATSDIIGRSSHSIEQRWYGKVRHSETVFMTIGAANMSVNSKVNNNPQPVRLPIWEKSIKSLRLMNNLKEAKELLEKYKSITLEQLTQKYKIFALKYFHLKEGRSVMRSITGFGSTNCILCVGANCICENCIYSFRKPQRDAPCIDIIYEEIEEATSAEELFNAIQKRISYLTHIIEWYETRR